MLKPALGLRGQMKEERGEKRRTRQDQGQHRHREFSEPKSVAI